MRWLGPMLHLLYPPRYDAHAAELQRLLETQRAATADMRATRERLEQQAAREPVDDLAEGL